MLVFSITRLPIFHLPDCFSLYPKASPMHTDSYRSGVGDGDPLEGTCSRLWLALSYIGC